MEAISFSAWLELNFRSISLELVMQSDYSFPNFVSNTLEKGIVLDSLEETFGSASFEFAVGSEDSFVSESPLAIGTSGVKFNALAALLL